jgi:hypothetical protein
VLRTACRTIIPIQPYGVPVVAFNLAFSSGSAARQRWPRTLVAVLRAVATVLTVLAGPAVAGASTDASPAPPPPPGPTESANTMPAARRALESWKTAVSPEEKQAALAALVALSTTHPLILAPLVTEEPPGDARIRAQWLEVVSQSGLPASLERAQRSLSDPDEAVAAVAATALGRSVSAAARESLIALWRHPAPPAPTVAEAAIRALARTTPASELSALQNDTHPGVRRAALNALRQQASPRCAGFLSVPELADEAAAAVYDDRLEGAWPTLIETGLRPDSALTAPGRERAIAAAWHGGAAAAAEQLAAWLAAQPPPGDTEAADTSARAAWRALLHWDTPPVDDPVVTGQPFHARPRLHAQAWDALRRHSRALTAWSTALGNDAPAAWKAWQAQLARAPRPSADFRAFLGDASHPEGERLHHFRTRLATTTEPAALAELAEAGLAAPDAPTLRAEARAWLFRRRGTDAVPWLLQSLAGAEASEKQAAIRLLDRHRSREGNDYLLRLLDQAARGLVDPSVLPEIVEAVERHTRAEGSDSRTERAALDAWRASQAAGLGDPLRPWRAALQPGDTEAGRTLFFSEAAGCASCHRTVRPDPDGAPGLSGVGQRLAGPALLEAVVRPIGPGARRPPPAPDGGCRPAGTLFTLRELRDLLAYLRSLP